MATTLSTALQTLSLQAANQAPSLQTLPDDIQQRVLAGVPLDDHQATAAACKAFRAVIRGPNFLALRRRYGFAERGVVVVENTAAPAMSLKVITSGITTNLFEGIRGGSPVRARHGAYPETPKALEAWLGFGKAFEQFLAATGEPPSAGWGPRNAFSFASAPAGAAKHGVSASVVLG